MGWTTLCFRFFWFVVGVFRINIIIGRLSRIFVFNFRCIKNFLVRRVLRQSFRDGIWKLFDDLRRMVRPWVDVKQLIFRFLAWPTSGILQVQSNVKKIYFFNIGLNVNTKTNVFENFNDSFFFFFIYWP